MRKFLLMVLGLVLVSVAVYGGLTWNNNRSASRPDRERMQFALNAAIQWTDDNSDKLLQTNNPMLWRMLQQSAWLTKDPRLLQLFREYEQRHLAHNARNLWRPLFYENVWVPVKFQDIRQLPYYNQHFIYSLICDRELWDHAGIRRQNEADFCDSHPLRSACVTHQLMGLRLQQRKQCTQDPDLDQKVSLLQARLVRQLTWDPRVVDVYLQRVLMLTESGATQRVKPVWLHHILAAQLPDGSWSSSDLLLQLTDNRALALTRNSIGIRPVRGSFHTTAQAIYLLSLHLNPDQSAGL